MKEIWKNVIGYESIYESSSLGNIRRIKGGKGAVTGRILKPYLNKSTGYNYIVLSKNCIQKQYLLHRVIAKSFFGESELQINHIDGNKTNNSINNLEYVSCLDNLLHASQTLKKRCCENHWNSKLTREQVEEIKTLRTCGLTHQEIADKFSISRVSITSIISGKRWANI